MNKAGLIVLYIDFCCVNDTTVTDNILSHVYQSSKSVTVLINLPQFPHCVLKYILQFYNKNSIKHLYYIPIHK